MGTTRYARCRTTCASLNVTHHALAMKTVGDLRRRVTATSWDQARVHLGPERVFSARVSRRALLVEMDLDCAGAHRIRYLGPMSTGDPRAAAADVLQAEHCREWLARERAELVAKLSKYEKMFEKCVASSDLRKLSHLRGGIRHTGNEIREIDRMARALQSRFAGPGSTTRQAGGGRLGQPFRRVPFNEKRNEIADSAAVQIVRISREQREQPRGMGLAYGCQPVVAPVVR